MSIVKPGLINPLTTAVCPDGASDKQLPGVGKPLGLGLCINGLWKGNETEPYYSVRKMIPLILVVGFSCFVGLILEIIMC